jgi:hypothetical protein
MEAIHDRRKLAREIVDSALELTWTDQDGVRHAMLGMAKDVSADGLSGVFPRATAIGQLVSIEFKRLGRFAHGVIRHSTPDGDDFLIGMAYIGEPYSAERPLN